MSMQWNYLKGRSSRLLCTSSCRDQTRTRNNQVSDSVWRISKNWKRRFIKWLLRNRPSITARTCYHPTKFQRASRLIDRETQRRRSWCLPLPLTRHGLWCSTANHANGDSMFWSNPCPFLAIGTARYHAEKNKDKFPQAAQVVKDDFYVDNLCSGDIRRRDIRCLDKVTRLNHDLTQLMTQWFSTS